MGAGPGWVTAGWFRGSGAAAEGRIQQKLLSDVTWLLDERRADNK